MQVRCCCNPEKLLGYLMADPSKDAVAYGVVETHENMGCSATVKEDHTHARQIILPIREIMCEGQIFRAIKAQDESIETLRKIHGFIEASG